MTYDKIVDLEGKGSEWELHEWENFRKIMLMKLSMEQLRKIHDRFGIKFLVDDPTELGKEDYIEVLSHDAPKDELIKIVKELLK